MTTDSTLALARRNAELLASVEELSQKLAQNEALTQLAAGTVHDLRNVFNVALLAAETLMQTLKTPDDQELAEAIFTAAQHGTQLAQDLLSFARGSQTGQTQCGELVPRLKRMIERIAFRRFEWQLEHPAELHTLRVEQAQLEAALINLVVNARDAMPTGGTLRVTLQSLPEDAPIPAGLGQSSYLQFTLTDTGHGMSREVLAHATEAFYTTKATHGGSGLGLAMAHAFAMRVGGALLLDSEPNHGTTVRLIVPRSGPTASTLPPPPSRQLDKIAQRIRCEELRSALASWRKACSSVDILPLPVALESRLLKHAGDSLTLYVVPGGEPPALQVLRVGSTLAPALERSPMTELPVEGPVSCGTLEAAYRRALLSRSPGYEYARYTLDGVHSSFERLILPAACDGHNVSHLFGIIKLSGALTPNAHRETDHD